MMSGILAMLINGVYEKYGRNKDVPLYHSDKEKKNGL